MIKKKSPKKFIESVDKPRLEENWAKLPRQEPFPISKERCRDEVISKRFDKPYMDIHTHPYLAKKRAKPSPGDYVSFLKNKNQRTMVVAQTNPKDGKLRGYYIVRKTKKTKDLTPLTNILDFVDFVLSEISGGLYSGVMPSAKFTSLNYLGEKECTERIEKLKEKYHLQSRYVPVEGHHPIEIRNSSIRKKGLEKIAIASMFAILGTIFIFSSNFTGNVISTNLNSTSNWIGGILLLIGLFGAFAYFRRKK